MKNISKNRYNSCQDDFTSIHPTATMKRKNPDGLSEQQFKRLVTEKPKSIHQIFSDDFPDYLSNWEGSDIKFWFSDAVEDKDGKMSIMKHGQKPTVPDYPEKINKNLTKHPELSPSNREDCLGKLLKNKVMRREISVIRNMSQLVGIKLDAFKTETLVKIKPQQTVETRRQLYQEGSDNFDKEEKITWRCHSSKDMTTLKNYARYQRTLQKGNLQDKITEITFGTNLDLSDEKIWTEQLNELKKLPPWAQLKCPDNFLSYTDMPILGMNTLQVYLKVPGSRTPAHQENNNFCSVNINVGPGVTQWFAVPFEQWGVVAKLCDEKGLKFLEDSWWPDIQTLEENGLVVYTFDQQPGDLVFVNIGCIHWVQAKSTCNNVAWNVGPLTVAQFDAAVERYEWNKIQHFPSVVPMQYLSWQLAKKFKTTDERLYRTIKITLVKSMVQAIKLMNLVGDRDLTLWYMPKPTDEYGMICHECKDEVFNICFVKDGVLVGNRLKVFCYACARDKNADLKGFKCIREYENDDLINMYDGFQLQKPSKDCNN